MEAAPVDAGPDIDPSAVEGPDRDPDRKEQRRLAAIARAASSVADTGSLSVTLDVVAHEVVQAEHIAAVQIHLVEGGRMRLVGKAGFTDAEDFPERLEQCRLLGAELMFVQAMRTAQRIIIPHRKANVLADPAWAPLHQIMGAPAWDSFVAVPLLVRKRPVGVMNAYYAPGEIPHTQTLEFLDAMADLAAMAVDSATLLARSRRDAVEAERARLARELHDSAVQHVFSMRMHATALRAHVDTPTGNTPDRVRAVADELATLAQHALADLRSLVLQLHPVELMGHDLLTALRAHAESVATTSGLRIDIDAEPPPDLPTELQEDLFRIVQEALHNTVKHAHADHATIHLHTHTTHLRVEVCDNGIGITPDTTPRTGALGLISMRERAERWGGTTHIDSDTGDGCHVSVRVPLP